MLITALVVGMTPKQFWEDEPQDYYSYLEAYNRKKQAEYEEMNNYHWQQGLYINLAVSQSLSDALNKQHKKIYPQEPIIKKAVKSKEETEKMARQTDMMVNAFSELQKNDKGRRNGFSR